MILAATGKIIQVNLIPTDGGVLDRLFHLTWIKINIFGLLGPDGFQMTLAGLIVLVLVGLAATAVAERLAGEKPGKNLFTTVVLTLIGAYIFEAFVTLPFTDVSIEGVRLISALLGAIIFGVFFVLVRRQAGPRTAKA